ncbi:hypothetical protein Q7P37_000901 [Cladosporium fusiforme]
MAGASAGQNRQDLGQAPTFSRSPSPKSLADDTTPPSPPHTPTGLKPSPYTMAAEQRKLLEQLMGDNLMSMPGTAPKQASLTITDPKVCRPYLVGSCPHDLFTNTKQDIGPCPKAHQANLREEYQNASESQKRDWGFEFDYYREINKYVSQCDRRIDDAHVRLQKTAEEIRKTNVLLKSISDMNSNINVGLEEIEALNQIGSVNMAVLQYHDIRLLKMQKEELERDLKEISDNGGPSGHQKLQVCETCGAYLSRLDNDRRLADHFFGKMHLGYANMRKECDRLKVELKGRAPPARNDYAEDDRRDGGYQDGGYGGGYGGGHGGRGYGRGGGGGGGFGRRGRGGYGGSRY